MKNKLLCLMTVSFNAVQCENVIAVGVGSIVNNQNECFSGTVILKACQTCDGKWQCINNASTCSASNVKRGRACCGSACSSIATGVWASDPANNTRQITCDWGCKYRCKSGYYGTLPLVQYPSVPSPDSLYCRPCPANANCSDGFFSCSKGYYQ